MTLKMPAWISGQSKFVKNISGMMLLVGLGQLMNVAAAPILTRLYTPEAMGQYGLLLNYVITCSLFTTLLLDYAIPSAESQEEAKSIAHWAAIFAIIFSITLTLVLAILIKQELVGFGSLSIVACPLVLIILLLQSWCQIAQGWLIRAQEAVSIGTAGLLLNFTRAATQVVGGFSPLGWIALVIGEAVGRLPSYVNLAQKSKAISGVQRKFWSFPELAVLKKYKRFPLVILPAQAIDSIVLFTLISSLTILYGVAGLGQYFLVRRVLDLPIAFVFKSLGDVFHGRMANIALTSPHSLRPFILKATIALLALGVLGCIPVVLFGPALFALMFGEPWREAGAMASFLIVPAALNLAVAPISKVFLLSRRASLRYSYTVLNAIGTGAAVSFATITHAPIVQATIFLAISTSIAYLGYGFAAWLAAAPSALEVTVDGNDKAQLVLPLKQG